MTVKRETTTVKEYEKKSMSQNEYQHEKLRRVSRKLFIDDILKTENIEESNEKCTISPEVQKYCKSFVFEQHIKS